MILLLLVAFALAGLYEVIVGSGGHNAAPGAFASGPAVTTPGSSAPTASQGGAITPTVPVAGPTVLTDCTLVAARPRAATIAVLFRHRGLPITDIGSTHASTGPHFPGAPTGDHASCSSQQFRDSRGDGVDEVFVYSSAAAAMTAAQQIGEASRMILEGPVVLRLDPSLTAYRRVYAADLSTIVASTFPGAAPATTTTLR